MCGIAGIIGRIDDANREALRRMSEALVHRGPDAEGTWEALPDRDGWGAMLCHRRLAILDLSPSGAQPMIDAVTGDVIVYNGEIYNYGDLRGRLGAEGQVVASTGDTAVVLRTLAVHGRDAVNGLRGMFAFAFWDRARRRLLLARDPLGIKPLYLARNPDSRGSWSVAFASELRALLASRLLGNARLDPDAVASVVWNGFVVGPGSAVSGVELLGPGRIVELDGRGAEIQAGDFWTVPAKPPNGMDERRVGEILEDTLRIHLASDVPLVVFLSGGVDSSAVANLAQRAARTPVHTFTLTFEAPEYDEGPIARRIAGAIGTVHHEVLLTEREFVGHLDAAVDSLDQPTFDGLNSYYMSRAVRSAGFTVALAGTGGDELFGGYTSFRDLPVLYQWSRALRWLPLGLRVAASRLATAQLRSHSRNAIPPQTRWAKLPDMVERGSDLRGLYQLAYALFLPRFQRELLAAGLRDALVDGLPPSMRERLALEIRSRSPRSAIGVMEHRLFLGERLLRDSDAASMASSIEQRVPLVDQVLFETVNALTDEDRFEPVRSKAMLRRIGLRGLPPELFDRPKSGFVLPYDIWIRRGLRKAIDETLRDPAAVSPVGLEPAAVARLWRSFLDGARGVYWSRVWAIYALVRWCHRNGVFL